MIPSGSRFDWPQAVRFCVRQDRTLKDVCLMEFHLSGRGADHQRITQEKEEEARLRALEARSAALRKGHHSSRQRFSDNEVKKLSASMQKSKKT